MGAAVQAEPACLPSPIARTSRTRAEGTSSRTPGLPIPKRRELLQLLGEVEAEARAPDHRIDPLGALQVLWGQNRGRMCRKRRSKGIEVLGPQLQPGRGPVPAEAPQVLGAGLQAQQAGRNPGMLRPEPRPPPSPSSEITTTGR